MQRFFDDAQFTRRRGVRGQMIKILTFFDNAFFMQQSQRLFHYLALLANPPSGDALSVILRVRMVAKIIEYGDRRPVYFVIVLGFLQDVSILIRADIVAEKIVKQRRAE